VIDNAVKENEIEMLKSTWRGVVLRKCCAVMMMMKVYSARLSLKGTSTIYMGSIPPVPPWSRDSPYVHFGRFLS
jgi:hypothetical protein